MKFILDTDILTLIHAGHSRVEAHRIAVASSEIATTIVTRIEILRGRFESVMKAADGDELLKAQDFLQRAERLLAAIPTVPFDRTAAEEFERMRDAKWARKVGRADLLIASIVISRRATLVTRNLKHFQLIPGLRVVNWAD